MVGGGYYSDGSENSTIKAYYGQGGIWYKSTATTSYCRDHAGSGGEAGGGGKIYYTDLSKIYAYNGDRITNSDYTTMYYTYKHIDGTTVQTTSVASIVTKKNGEIIIPATIIAQTGVIRATYKTNQHIETEAEATALGVKFFSGSNPCATYVYTAETTTATTEYGQGIGSGAGMLEKSNGILEQITK